MSLHQVMPLHLRVLMFIWAFVAMSTNLKTEFIPNIDWYISGLLLLFLLQYSVPKLKKSQLGLLAAILLAGITSESLDRSLIWVTKLGVIFLCLSCIVRLPWPPTPAIAGIITSLAANVLLILLGTLGFNDLFKVVGAYGRSATMLNYPGALWRTGMVFLFYFSYLAIFHSGRRVFYVTGLAACLVVMLVDGSRTGMLVLCFLPAALAYVSFRNHPMLILFSGIVSLLVLPVIIENMDFSNDHTLGRMAPLLESNRSINERLMDWAPSRYEMVRQSVEMIGEHPLVGNGLRAAEIEYRSSITGQTIEVVVHNGYLQAWVGMGLFGFTCYSMIVLGWLKYLSNLTQVLCKTSVFQRALLYNAVFILIVFSFSLLFHPMSVEWSEWIVYLMPYAILARSVNGLVVAPQTLQSHEFSTAIA